MISAMSAVIRSFVRFAEPSPAQRKYSAVPTRPVARPPNAWESAVRWGTAVSATCESGHPTRIPAARAMTTQRWCEICGCTQVARMAISIAATPE